MSEAVGTPFRIIPVIDVKNGEVVHALGGDRRFYRPPIDSKIAGGSDPLIIATALRERFGFDTVYLADLDAIESNRVDFERLQQLGRLDLQWMADLGIRDTGLNPLSNRCPRFDWILATETLPGPAALRQSIATSACPERLIFGVDLRQGRLPHLTIDRWQAETPGALIEIAVETGLRRLLLLDLDRIGKGDGTGLFALVRHLGSLRHDLEIFVGGGIGGIDEVWRWRDEGIAGVLVGTALHDGRIDPHDVRRIMS